MHKEAEWLRGTSFSGRSYMKYNISGLGDRGGWYSSAGVDARLGQGSRRSSIREGNVAESFGGKYR